MEFKVDVTSKGNTIQVNNGTADAWGAYLTAVEGSNVASIGAFTDTNYFEISAHNEDHGDPDVIVFQASVPIRMETDTGEGITINNDGTLKFTQYTAGVLTADGSGNITSVAGGTGATESFVIAMAIALG